MPLPRFAPIVCGGAAFAVLANCSVADAATGPMVGQGPRGGNALISVDSTPTDCAAGRSAGSVTTLAPPWSRSSSADLPVERRPIKRFISPAITAPGGAHLFVSDSANDVVYIYNVAGKLTGTLTGFSFGRYASGENVAVDKSGNLYVADTRHNVIEMYAPPYDGTPRILVDDQVPQGVAVDGNGSVAAANYGSSAPGSVSFYAKGATNPTNIVYLPLPFSEYSSSVDYLTFDAHGNVYLDWNAMTTYCDEPFLGLGEIAGGITAGTVTLLNANGIGGSYVATGVQVTRNGLIAFDIYLYACNAIWTYKPPKNGSFGNPLAGTPLSTPSCAFTFGPTDSFVFTADGSNATVSQYAYPGGGSPVKTLHLPAPGFAEGVAVNPPQQ